MSLFFFLMSRRPPRSTLFPTRRSSDLDAVPLLEAVQHVKELDLYAGRFVRREGFRLLEALAEPAADYFAADHHLKRSEEHTSELQSLAYLVCRLLLEKKKKPPIQTSKK